jgi:hypothetical protein
MNDNKAAGNGRFLLFDGKKSLFFFSIHLSLVDIM